MYVFELLPAGRKIPKGLFICLHGFPAWSTKNYDIGEQLCLLGYAVLIPHYPGLGFSKGDFSFKRSRESIDNFLAFAKRKYRLPLSLMGHSWGGYLAISLCRHVDKLLLLFAPLSIIPTGKPLRALVAGLLVKHPSDCRRYTKARMQKELESLGAALSPADFVETMARKPFLVVHGTNDDVIPLKDSSALVAKAKGSAELIELEDEHLLFRHRRELLDHVSDWVKAKGR
jgi:pimeloyl-ACP methyl ester carboxylesterase